MLDRIDFWLTRSDRTGYLLWFALGLLVAGYGGAVALGEAFAATYIIQDDARQHVVWALRFIDPELFPNDQITDYFRAVAPAGYAAVYRAGAALGIDPILLSKVLPFFLGLILAGFGFALGCQLVRLPIAGFLVSWTMTENAWLMDNVASATPRAFLYPLFAAFLYYFLKRSGWGVAVSVLLLGLFYPQSALVAAGLCALAMIEFRRGKPRLARSLDKGRIAAFGVAAAIIVLAPYALQSATHGPVISPEEARQLPEFWVGQRAAFYDNDIWRYWTCGERSGLFPIEWCQLKDEHILGLPATVVPFFFLILFLALPVYLRARRGGLGGGPIEDGIYLIPRLLLVSAVLFLAAHAILFQLHLPNRYTQHTIRFAFDMAFGIGLTLLLLKALDWAKARQAAQNVASAGLLIGLGALLLALPIIATHMGDRLYVSGRHPTLYAYLARTPKESMVASIEDAGNDIPAFARRPILFGWEYGIPYQLGYYRPFRERGRRIAEAQYTDDPGVLRRFLRDYDVDFWLLDRGAFEITHIEDAWWARQYPTAHQIAQRNVVNGVPPVLAVLTPVCIVSSEDPLVLVDADCLRGAFRR